MVRTVKDYNVEIHYHPGNANVVADAWSRKSYGPKDAHLQEEMARLNMHIVPRGFIRKMSIQPTPEDKIRKAQSSDKDLMKIRMQTGENTNVHIVPQGSILDRRATQTRRDEK